MFQFSAYCMVVQLRHKIYQKLLVSQNILLTVGNVYIYRAKKIVV
jgi:hypothetical protein